MEKPIRYKLFCRRCKVGKPEIKDWFNKKTLIQYYYCRKCNTERARNYRNTVNGALRIRIAVKKSILKHPERQKARMQVRSAIKSGFLVRKLCEKCGDKNTYAHHVDYGKPLEVLWLCRSCHSSVHKGLILV